MQDLGVPKFLINKWLNVQNSKSKFADATYENGNNRISLSKFLKSVQI